MAYTALIAIKIVILQYILLFSQHPTSLVQVVAAHTDQLIQHRFSSPVQDRHLVSLAQNVGYRDRSTTNPNHNTLTEHRDGTLRLRREELIERRWETLIHQQRRNTLTEQQQKRRTKRASTEAPNPRPVREWKQCYSNGTSRHHNFPAEIPEL